MTHKLKLLIVLFAVALVAVPVAAQQQPEREKPPTGGAPRPFVFPKAETYKLPNGMTVTLVPYGSVPKVTFQTRIRTGNIDETAEQTYLADLTGEMLKQGSTTRSGEQIAREAAEMGGTFVISTGLDQIIVGGDVLSDFDARFVNLMADVLLNPAFPAAELDRIKTDAARNVAVAKTEPGNIALAKFRETLYPNHPFGRLYPAEQQVLGYKLEDLRGFYARNYGAQRAHLYVVGQFNRDAVRKAIETGFGKMPGGTAATINVPKPTATRSLVVVDRPNASQSTLNIGLPAVDPSNPDYVAVTVMNALLGGSFGSRITSNIREAKGYTYSPYSSVWTRYRTGYWVQVADVTTAVTGASIKEILFEIDRLREEPPTAAELDGIKSYLAGLYVIQNSSRQGVIARLHDVNYNGLDKNYLDTYVAKIAAVTPEQVQQMAAKYLRDDALTIVVVGDRAKIADQIAVYQK